MTGALVLVERGNCSFVRKYETVVAAGAKGMLLFNSAPGEQDRIQHQMDPAVRHSTMHVAQRLCWFPWRLTEALQRSCTGM